MQRFDSLVHATADGSWFDPRYDASEARLIESLDDARIDRACLVAIAGFADNETVLALRNRYPGRFVPVGSINPTTNPDQIGQQVQDLADQGFQGLKLHARLNEYDPMSSECVAAINAASDCGLVAFVDTYFRQRRAATRHPADIVDYLATQCAKAKMIMLHATGASLLDLFELGRMHPHVILDLSLTLLRYRGSSIDMDIRFLFRELDERVVVGSDFPQHLPGEAFEHVESLLEGLPLAKRENVLFKNLDSLFPNELGR